MTDYTELVKALRCGEYRPECGSSDCPYWSGLGCMDGQLIEDAAAAIEELQREVDELREAQTYIDRYGDEWMTSAKDVPTAAYEHGYFDGKNHAEQQLEPKRGEWIDEDLDNFRKYKVTCPHCGAWYVGNYDAYVEPWDFNYCPHCGNICNPTNIEYENELKEREKEARAKMEVQDGQK